MSYWGHVIASFRMVLSATNLAIFKWIFIIAMLCTAFVSKAGNDTQILIKFAAIDWCPQLCQNADEQGYIIDILKQIYPETEYKLEVNFFPWSRAIKFVRDGDYHALLSPAKYEAPDLFYPSYPVGFQQMCFFTLRQSNFQFSGIESLQGLEIGIAADTSIEVLNKFISENTHQFQIQPYVDRFIEQSAKKLLKKRIDTFVFTLNASVKELTRLGLSDQIRTAGCVNKENVYVAFSSHADLNEMVMRLSDRFDDVYPELLNSGWIDLIYQKYGIVSVSSIYEQLILIK